MNETKTKKKPWNYGKRKPNIENGKKWCACIHPKLTHGIGSAMCLLCGYPWYH